MLLAVWITSSAWGPRPISGDDVMALLMRADRGLAIAGNGHLDGWSPDFILGYQQFLYYGPGFTWTVGLVKLLSFGLLSTEGALKVVAIATVAAIGPATAFLARSFGLSERAAGTAAILALAVDSVFGLGLHGTFLIALVPHQLAGTALCVGVGAAVRTMTDPRRRWPVVLALAVAMALITHLITTVVMVGFIALATPFLLLTDRLTVRAVARVAAGGFGGAALAGFWFVPYLGHFANRGEVPAWATPPIGRRVDEILDGNVLFGPHLGWLVLAGWVYALVVLLVVRRQRWAGALVGIPVGFLAVSHLMASRWPGFDLSPQLANRGLGYAGLVALLPLAALVSRGAGYVGRAEAAIAFAVAVVLVVVVPGSPRGEARQQPEAVPQMAAAAAVLREVVPTGARFATHRDFPAEIGATGVSHPDFWLARQSGRPTLNVFGLELSPSGPAAGVPEAIGRVAPEYSAEQLGRLGVSHVVTVNDTVFDQLDASPGFRKVWRQSPLGIFEVPARPGQPDPAALVTTVTGTSTAELRAAGDERYEIAIRSSEATEAVVAVGWSPKWHVTVDGRPRPVRRTPEGAMGVPVPIGQSVIALEYRRDGWDRLGLGLTLVTLAAGAALAYRSSSRRSSRSSRTA